MSFSPIAHTLWSGVVVSGHDMLILLCTKAVFSYTKLILQKQRLPFLLVPRAAVIVY